MRWQVPAAFAAAVLVSVVVAGCGEGGSSAAVEAGPTASVDLAAARDSLLSPSEVAGLNGATTTMDASDISSEASDPDVATWLDDDEFVGAVRRDLRGRARDVTGADSRVLVFADAEGAASFLQAVADDPDPFFGAPSTVRPLSLGETDGVLIKPPVCACAGAQPVYVALATHDNQLLWLQITGPRVTAADAKRLLSTVL